MNENPICVICLKPIVGKKRLTSRYCGRACINKATDIRRKQERIQRRDENERILQTYAVWFTMFRFELLRHAPSEAGGYQLGLWTGQMMYWFPSLLKRQSYRHTLYRTRTTNQFFSLSPFEPPTVPLVTDYQVRFVHKIPPHPELPQAAVKWWKKIPYAVPHRALPFILKAVPRDKG